MILNYSLIFNNLTVSHSRYPYAAKVLARSWQSDGHMRMIVHGDVRFPATLPVRTIGDSSKRGEKMKKHSRRKSRCEEAILFHHPAHATQLRLGSFSIKGKARPALTGRSRHDLFIVSEAYQEPGGCDYIEEILMQRDYIID